MNEDHQRIWEEWHRSAMTRDVGAQLALYAPDAVLETPFIPYVLDQAGGVARGHDEIERFLRQAAKKAPELMKPEAVMRWWRSDDIFSQGDTLMWEYPRETPEGEQVDIMEVMQIRDGLIRSHRVYWGWKTLSVTRAR